MANADVNELLAGLAKLVSQQSKPAKKTKKAKESNRRPMTEQERRAIVEAHASGVSICTLEKTHRRGWTTIQKVVADAAKKAPKVQIKVTEETAIPGYELETVGLGSIKRSMERLHDRVTQCDNKIASLATRLNDVTAMVALVQKSVDRVVRELVTTNPPPAELVIPTVRNNAHTNGV